MSICMNCRMTVPDGGRVCPYCHEKFYVPQTAQELVEILWGLVGAGVVLAGLVGIVWALVHFYA